MSEQINIPGIQVAGTFPAELNIDIHYSGAVLVRTASPEEAASFLSFISRPEAAATLVKTGIAAPKG
jgi:molybdate transport system substrate-binding protein